MLRNNLPFSVFASARGGSPSDDAAIIGEFVNAFEQFKTHNDDRIDKIEASLDRMGSNVAASMLGGGAGSPISGEHAAYAKGQDGFFRRGANAGLRHLAVKAALGAFGRTGEMAALAKLSPQAALHTESGPDGGYLMPDGVAQTIVDVQLDISPMRRLAQLVTTTAQEYPAVINIGGSTANWVGEREARSETNGPKLARVTVPVNEITASPAISQTLLDNSPFNIGDFITNAIANEFELTEGASFVSGDGVKKPKGFLSCPVSAVADATRPFGTLQYVVSGDANGFVAAPNSADTLDTLIYSLRGPYRQNGAAWLMNSSTASLISRFKDSQGGRFWQPSGAAGTPPTLLGYPVEIDENMPSVAAGMFPIAFGDWKRGYLIVDRQQVRILRDPFTNKPFVMFYTTKRVGGGVLDTNAIKLLKISA